MHRKVLPPVEIQGNILYAAKQLIKILMLLLVYKNEQRIVVLLSEDCNYGYETFSHL